MSVVITDDDVWLTVSETEFPATEEDPASDALFIQSGSLVAPLGDPTLDCTSDADSGPTLADILLVDIAVDGAAADGTGSDHQTVTISLDGGPIEDMNGFDVPIDVDLGDSGELEDPNSNFDDLIIRGSDDPDLIRAGDGDGTWAALDLDGDDFSEGDIIQVAFTNVEHLRLEGNDGDDTLDLSGGVGAGDPFLGQTDLDGGPGADALVGGDGRDTANYSSSLHSEGVVVDLDLDDETGIGAGWGGWAEGDSLEHIENLFGTSFDDELYGNSGTNSLIGFDGNDTLGGDSGDDHESGNDGDDVFTQGEVPNGADVISGDDGTDVIYYCRSNPVSVTNDATANDGEEAEEDDVSGIEDHNTAGEEGCEDTPRPTTCSFDSALGTIDVEVGTDSEFALSRSGSQIVATGSDGVLDCADEGTQPTVSNVDSVSVIDTIDGSTEVTLDQTNGAFAPGKTTEGDSMNEIELSLDLGAGDQDAFQLIGTSGADGLNAGSSSLNVGVVNNGQASFDLDSDITFAGVELVQADGRGGDDRFSLGSLQIETILDGGDGSEHLQGGTVTNTLNGGEGFDVLFATAAPDLMNGDGGEDVAFFNDSPAGVTVNLQTGTASGGWAEGDSFGFNAADPPITTVENINGSSYGANNLTGNAASNWINGGPEDDVLSGGAGGDIIAGLAGEDTIDGGTGVDGLNYMDSPSGVVVDLDLGIFEDGYEDNSVRTEDIVTTDGTGNWTIEDVRGSGCHPQDCIDHPERANAAANADLLIGDDRDNRLEGMGGPDMIVGGDGDDMLNANEGDDIVSGGEGSDRIPQNSLRDGADDVHGDGGHDFVDYNERSLPASVTTSDNLPNDGELPLDDSDLGEGDNIHDDVEEVSIPSVPWPDCNENLSTNCILEFGYTDTDPDSPQSDLDKMKVEVRLDTHNDGFAQYESVNFNVLFDRGFESDLFGDRDLIASSAPLTMDSVVTVKLAVGDIDPTMVFSTGQVAEVDGVSQVVFGENADGNTVELQLRPRPLEFVEPDADAGVPNGCQIDDCGDNNTWARRGFQGAIGGQILSVSPSDELAGEQRDQFQAYIDSAKGSWVATNAQAWTNPVFEDGALRFQLAAAHRDHNGLEYPGFFAAFLPNSLLSDSFGMTEEEIAGLDAESFEVDVTKESGTETKTPDTQAGQSGTIDGVRLTLDDFTYSSPEMAIREAVEASPPATDPGSTSPPSSGSDPGPGSGTTPPAEEDPAPEPPQEEVEAPSEGGTLEEDNAIISVPDGGEPIEVIGDDNTILVGGDTETTVDGDNNNVIVDSEEATIDLEGDGNSIDSTEAGDVTLTVEGDANTIEMGEGQDDLVIDGEGNTAETGAGADDVDVSGSNNTVDMGDGSDLLTLEGDGNTAEMGAGQDEAVVGGTNNTVDMGEGDDSLMLSGSGNTADLGAGDDESTITNESAPASGIRLMAIDEGNTVMGGVGDDRLTSRDGSDALSGQAGDDVLRGGGGSDAMRGDGGTDIVTGGSGNDRVVGGAGQDQVNGSAGNDAVYGGDGNDVLEGGRGADRIYGGTGRDRLNGDVNDEVIDGGPGKDTLV
jgi:Ca2+-binding RTX toxin-like protein